MDMFCRTLQQFITMLYHPKVSTIHYHLNVSTMLYHPKVSTTHCHYQVSGQYHVLPPYGQSHAQPS